MIQHAKKNVINHKPIWLVLAVLLFLCFLSVCIGIFLFKDLLFKSLQPSTLTPTPTQIVSATETPTPVASVVTGSWQGTYIINSPKGCAGGTGTWNANLLEQNGVLSGSYSSDVGLGGNVSGTISGSNVNWNVGGSGGVTFTGGIISNVVSGNFTGPICSIRYSIHTTGTFTGNRQ